MKNTSVFHTLFRTVCGGAALAVLALVFAAPVATARDVAIVVGINHYDKAYIENNDLMGCIPDATQIHAMLDADPFHLVDTPFGDDPTDPKKWVVVQLADELATKAVIRSLLHYLADPATSGDAEEVLDEAFPNAKEFAMFCGMVSTDEEAVETAATFGITLPSDFSLFSYNLLRTVGEILNAAEPLGDGDRLFYYHSSHGGNLTDPYGKSVCLCTYDANYTDAEIAADLQRFAPGTRILSVADTCHSGGLDPLLTTVPRPVLAAAVSARLADANVSAANIGWISAAPYDDFSYDSDSGGQFTSAFLAAIANGANSVSIDLNADHHVSAYEAWRYAAEDANISSAPQIFNAPLCEQFHFGGYDEGAHHCEIEGPAIVVAGSSETYSLYEVHGYLQQLDAQDDLRNADGSAVATTGAYIRVHGWREVSAPDPFTLCLTLVGGDRISGAHLWNDAEDGPHTWVVVGAEGLEEEGVLVKAVDRGAGLFEISLVACDENGTELDDGNGNPLPAPAGEYEVVIEARTPEDPNSDPEQEPTVIASRTVLLVLNGPDDPVIDAGKRFTETRRVPLSDGTQWSVEGLAGVSIQPNGVLTCPTSAAPDAAFQVLAANNTVSLAVRNSPYDVVVAEAVSFAEALDNALIAWSTEPGDADWYGQSGTTFDGEDALSSGLLPGAGTSVFSGTFSGIGLLSFCYSVEGGSGGELVATADGKEFVRTSATRGGWRLARVLLGAGDHVVRIAFTRSPDDPGYGQNRAWIDRVVFQQGTYVADMNANAQGWTVGGTGVGDGQGTALWQRGVPSFGPLDGRICWGTILNGRYPSEANGWVESPELAIDADSTLAFNTWFDIDNTAWRKFVSVGGDEYSDGFKGHLDGGVVEISVNNGGWSNITASVSAPGNVSSDTIAGSSGGWVSATAPLPDWAVGGKVRIRFRFASDSYVKGVGNPAGWFIDDVSIFAANSDDIVLRSATVQDTAQGNNNGIAEPGESVWVCLNVVNQGATDRTGVVGSVRCSTPGVTLAASPASVTYGDISAYDDAAGAPRLLVTLDPSIQEGTVVRLLQTVTDDTGDVFENEFSFPVRIAAAWSGTVDELVSTGSPAPSSGALVTLDDGVRSYAVTTSAGAFSFAAVPAGDYSLTIAKDGFTPFGPVPVSVRDGETASFQIGRAYAIPNADSFHFDLPSGGATLSETLSLRNGTASVPGTVPTTVQILFPEGQPAWLLWDVTEATIPAGATQAVDFRFSVAGAALRDDPRTETIVRIISNDCQGRSPQDIQITLSCAGITDAIHFVSAIGATTYDDPAGTAATADGDGYLERCERGYIWFSFRNQSDVALSNLVVESAVAVDGASGADFGSFDIDTAAVQARVPRIDSFGEAFSVPAIPVSVPAVDVEDPWYAIEVTLRDPVSGLASVSTNTIVLHDRHSVSGTVYSAVRPVYYVTNAIIDRYIYTATNDVDSVPVDPAALKNRTPDDGYPQRIIEMDVAADKYADYKKSSAWGTNVRVLATSLATEPILDDGGEPTGEERNTQVQLDVLRALVGDQQTNAVLRVFTFTALTDSTGVYTNSLDVSNPIASLVKGSTLSDSEEVSVPDALFVGYDEVTGEYTFRSHDEFLAEYPAVEVLEEDDAGEPVVVRYTRFDRWTWEYRKNTKFRFDDTIPGAVVRGVGDGELVETVTFDDGTYILHGLRNGYGKIYAIASIDVDNHGTGDSPDLVAQGVTSTPVVFGNLPAGLPDFTAGEGVDLYLIGYQEAPCLQLADVSISDANGNGVFEPGEEFSFAGTVENVGSVVAETVTLEFSCLFPEGFDASTYPSATFSEETITLENANLGPGESTEFSLDGNLFGTQEGTASVLVRMTAVDPSGATNIWWGTFDLISDGIAFVGTVYLDSDDDPAPLGGVRLFLESLDGSGAPVATQIGESYTPTSDELESERGRYFFTLRDHFDNDVRIRVQPSDEFLPQDLEISLLGPQSRSLVGLDFHLIPSNSTGTTNDTLRVVSSPDADGNVSTNALFITHPEGQATNATLHLTNGSSATIELSGAVVRYERSVAEYGQGVARRGARAYSAIASEEAAESVDDPVNLENLVPGECFVTFRSDLDEAAQEAILASAGASVARRYRLLKAVLCHYDVPEDGTAADAFLRLRAALLATGDVLKVEPARVIHMEPSLFSDAGVPNDRRIDNQWALLNERQTGGSWGADIDVASLWASGRTGSRDVIVAVMDTGVDIDHPDLIPNLWVNEGEIPNNGIDDDDNGYIDDVHGWSFANYDNEVDDPNNMKGMGHGTHVAGIIGAVGDNAIGIAGVNWRVRILPIRIADDNGNLTATSPHVAEAFEYMVACGASVVNCSWGAVALFTEPVVADAIKSACDTHGLLLVTSAGNEAMDNDRYRTSLSGLRGSVDNMIVVAAADHDGKIASFSNYGAETVDIAAPGVDILSCMPRELGPLWRLSGEFPLDENYVLMSGTSMASPYVAGAAALLKSICPGSSTADIRKAILDGARRDPNLAGWVSTSGHLDVAAAAAYLGSEWLVPVTDIADVVLAPGESMDIDFDVNRDLRLRAGIYTATISLDYAIGDNASSIVVPVTDVVTAAPFLTVVDVTIDDSVDGDDDGYAEPGEKVGLTISVRNDGSRRLTSVTGSVSVASATWPTLPSAGMGANVEPLTVIMPATAGDAEFTLELTGTPAGEVDAITVTLPFTVPVAARGSITGTVRTSSGAPVPGAVVEFWTDATPAASSSGATLAGRVEADDSGAYRIDGLLSGAHVALRAIPDGFARSGTIEKDIADGTTVADVDFTVGAAGVWFPGLPAEGFEADLIPRASASASLLVTNHTADSVAWTAQPIVRKRVLLLSDAVALNPLAPVIEALGFAVDVVSNNYEFVTVARGSYNFENVEHRGVSQDIAALLPYDFVIADFDGDRQGGRQLNAAEQEAIRAYLAQGGRLLVTGGSLLASPDNDGLAAFLGVRDARFVPADMLAPAVFVPATAALPAWTFSGATASFAEVSGTQPATAALPADASDTDIFGTDASATVLAANAIDAEPSVAKLLRVPVGDGVLYYWGANSGAVDVAPRGVRQDLLRDILYAELLEPVDWVSVPASGSFAAGGNATLPVTIDASTLPLGDHEASIVFLGAFADAETVPVRVAAHVVQPSFTALSTLGVTNAFGAFLKGDGQEGSCVFQLIATTNANGAVSAPNPSDGMPSGGEAVLVSTATGLPYGRFGGATPDFGQFSDVFEVPVTGADTWVVVRAWNGPAVGGAALYGDSAPYKVQFIEDESYDFGQWCVGTLFNWPAAPGTDPIDSNGDGLPDGYILTNPDLSGTDPASGLVAENDMAFLQKLTDNAAQTPYRVFATDRYVYSLSHNANQWGISVWTTNGLHGTYLGTFVPADGLFQDPYGMGRQPGAFRFAIANSGKNSVCVFDFDEDAIASAVENGESLADAFTLVWSSDATDSAGGPLDNPQGVAMDADGAVYVADTGSGTAQQGRRVVVLNADGSVRSECLPTGDYKLVSPAGIGVDSESGDIFVANTGAGNIVRLTEALVPTAVYTSSVEDIVRITPSSFVTNTVSVPVAPTDVSVWTVGGTFRLLVADREGNAVHVLDSTGAFIATFANKEEATVSQKDGKLRRPWGVYGVPDTADAWVADTSNNRLQRFGFTLDGDGDGIEDTTEMLNGLDPLDSDPDTDGDGLYDSAEILIGTNPLRRDTDGGGVNDGDEVRSGLNPLDPSDDTNTVALVVSASPAEGGSVSGAGSYAIGTIVDITATPSNGWVFAGWQDDGSTDSPRTVEVTATGNSYVALFERQTLVVAVQYVTDEGDPSDIVPAGNETFETYYGLLFHQDRSALFVSPYSFVSGSDTLSNAYSSPVIDFAEGDVVSDVTVTFVVNGGSVSPDEPVPPLVTATAIAVDGTTLRASFTTDATAEAQFGSFMNDGRTATTLLVTETLADLSAYRAWRAANPEAARSTYTGAIRALPAAVVNPATAVPFTFDITVDLSAWTADALFIVGFEKP